MSSLPPGSARGDVTVSAGRTTLGFIRGDTPRVQAFAADGTTLGVFKDRKGAVQAINIHATWQGGAA